MLFNSLIFAVFLAVVLTVYYAASARYWRGLKLFLLFASYFFYGWWDIRFVSLLVISTLVDFAAVRQIQSKQGNPKAWLMLSLVVNLGILGFFKYADFFIGNAEIFLQRLGLDPLNIRLDVILPVGISFYTFQTLSLTLDAFRGKITERYSLLDVALYVAFFPQLVAGPIVRAVSFLPQIQRKPRFRAPIFMWGWWLVWLGLFKKVIIADSLAKIVDQYMATADLAGASMLVSWKAAVCFSLQIYCDFSGYSDIAIGVACLMGLRFPVNFMAPYIAISFSDFWRRWHISLSTWLRDYLYIPLGGNRKGRSRTYINLMITMLLGGLWHGASWNFVLWGGIHGVLLCLERLIFGKNIARHKRPKNLFADLVRTLAVFVAVTLAWVPFRCPSFTHTLAMYRSMFTNFSNFDLFDLRNQIPVVLLGLGMIVVAFLRDRRMLPRRGPAWLRVVASVLIIYTLANYREASRAFIYFQF